jgi:CRP/FNR family transcriptional regulator, cyclic AMP receptor protein
MTSCTPGLAVAFLRGQPWFASLESSQQAAVQSTLQCIRVDKGQSVFTAGSPVLGWHAVLEGLVKLQTGTRGGRVSSFLGVSGGEWFGEGSALRQGAWRYEVVALRSSTLVCMPIQVFSSLEQHSLAFNRFLAAHLNRRLSQAMAMIEADRLRSPDQRVALYLTRVFWPGVRKLSLTQEELGHLVGLSRQTVNRVLHGLVERQLVSLSFGRVAILDEPGLLQFAQDSTAAR